MIASNNPPGIWRPHKQIEVGRMQLVRPPLEHQCPKCRRRQVIVFPAHVGAISWQCPCDANHRQEFGQVPEIVVPQEMMVRPSYHPVQHTCDDCGAVDWLVVPLAGGDARWTCRCGTVWLFRWTPESCGRGRVMQGPNPKPPEKPNLCGCNLEGCPHCKPK